MPSIHQEESVVTRQFEEQVELYSEHADAHSLIVPFLQTWLVQHPAWLAGPAPLVIGEFGGGGGILLRQLHDRFGAQVALHNIELVERYQAFQASPAIQFHRGSVLDSGFPAATFDVTMVRNVLHHLIGPSLAQTRQNQAHALTELLRMTRPGGLILVQEQVNQYGWACGLLYYLSRGAARLNLRIESFEITPSTVVAYLTHAELLATCRACVPEALWLANDYARRQVAWRWKLTLLMSNNGDAFIAMQRPGESIAQ